jgi:SAM-dependent methyltransferase
LHKHFLTNQTVFEIGTNLNFYAVWSILNGAQLVDGIEPSTKRYYLAKEYAKIRAPGKISTQNVSIDEYMHSHCDKQYDVVMFLDVFYYLQNGVEVLKFIRDRLKPKYLFFETTVVDDYCEPGHMQVEYSTTDPLAFKSFTTSDASQTLGFIPSRNALKNIFADQGWEIVTYYNYADFVGRGESGPRRRGQKDFYVLKNSA